MDSLTKPLPRPSPALAVRRWFARPAADLQVGVQWIGDRLAVARVRHGPVIAVERVDSFATPAPQRHALVRALKAKGVFRGRVRLLLAPGQYEVHQVAAPAVPAADLHDALRWQLRSNLGYPPDEALLDFARLPQPLNAPARNALLVVTAARSAVAEAMAPLAACGVAVDSIDVPEFAQRNLARWLTDASSTNDSTNAWLSFDADTLLLTVHHRGELAFARRMLLPNVAAAADGATDAAAHFVARTALQVSRSLDLFERQSGLPPVAHLVIGPHEHAAALARDIGNQAALRVTEAATSGPLLDLAVSDAMLLPALGATLQPADWPELAQSIDLLRVERAKAKPRHRKPLPLAAWAIGAAAAALVVHAAVESRALDMQRQSLARLHADAQRAEKIIDVLGSAHTGPDAAAAEQAAVAALESQAAQLRSAVPGRSEPFIEPLTALARARVAGVWLTAIRLNAGGVALEGRALDAARVPDLLEALRREPRFAGTAFARIELQPARADANTPAEAVQFRIATEDSAGAAR